MRVISHVHLRLSFSWGCEVGAFKLHTFGKISVEDLLSFVTNTPLSSIRTTLASNLAFLDDTQLWIYNSDFRKGLERK